MMKFVGRALFAIVAVLALLDPVDFRSPSKVWGLWAVQVFLMSLLGLMLFWKLYRFYRAKIKPTHARSINDIKLVPEEQAYQLQELAAQVSLTAKQARIFPITIIKPSYA